jgi:hypothetical protein
MTTIETTLGQLADAEPALTRLGAEKLPFQAAYQIAKLAKAVAEETKHFYEQRNALVKEYGERKPGGGPDEIQVGPTMTTWPTFVAKVSELVTVSATIPQAPLDLTGIEGLSIAATDLLLLGPLVTLDKASEDPPVAVAEPARPRALRGA